MDDELRKDELQGGSDMDIEQNVQASTPEVADSAFGQAPIQEVLDAAAEQAPVQEGFDAAAEQAPVQEGFDAAAAAVEDENSVEEEIDPDIPESDIVPESVSAPAPTMAPVPAGRGPKKTTIGGQALIEGIMMCGPRRTAIAVRKADGSIYVEEIKKSASETFFEKVPLIRGCIRFFRQLVSGTAALMRSAEISEEGAPEESVSRVAVEEDKPKTIQAAKAEQKASSKTQTTSKLDQFADKHSDGVMIFAAVLGLAFSVVLFILLPRLIVDTALHFFSAERSDSVGLNVALNFVEGVVRIVIFLSYLAFTSKLKDIARVWMYHGAEHKTIACYEAGEELTVANVRKCSRFHPRCGTAFLFIVVLVSILVFCVASVFIGVQVWWVNMLVRLALVPLVGGISYEILRFCGRHDQNPICKIFIAPGLALQKLTTKEPTDSMIEVAIASVQAVIPENSNEDVW